ncbi:hypothetical protein F5I97DRAFT_1981873 [Phlebopus sp. FC_14]|nr:hypothetical protein F5I97DRAFT_1981873 [Phlebopus sp. FC_14]
MPLPPSPVSPFNPRPAPTAASRPEDPATSGTRQPFANSSALRSPNEAVRQPRSILRPSHPPQPRPTYDPLMHQYTSRPPPQPHPNASRIEPNHHYQRPITPDLRPRADSAWAPRPPTSRAYHELIPSGYISGPAATLAYIPPRFLRDPPPPSPYDAHGIKRNSMPPHIHNLPGRFFYSPHFPDLSGRMPRTPPADLEGDRLARACGQSPAIVYAREEGAPAPASEGQSSSRILRGRQRDCGESTTNGDTPNPETSRPLVSKIKPSQMYRRLDALARRYNHRAMDYLSFEDVVVMYKNDVQLRGQLLERQNGRVLERDPGFHVMGAPLEDIVLYASTTIQIGEYRHYLPIVVVACVEELTKTGIYQNGLFRALPSRDRHLQLIDIFDKSPNFGAGFNMRGQAMPDICAVLSTFISSLPKPLVDPHIYSAFWQWCVKPSVKREDARREQEDFEEEERVAKGEPARRPRVPQDNLRLGTDDLELEGDQICTAQVLLRLLPMSHLSLLTYLCGFFTQLPLCPENGMQFEDIARIFGHRLLGGSVKMISQKMMVWLLSRWSRVSEGLFAKECGLSRPSSPVTGAGAGGGDDDDDDDDANKGEEEQEEEGMVVSEKRKKSSSGSSSDSLHRAPSSPSPDSPEDRSGVSRRSTTSSSSSSSDEEDDVAEERSRRRKKREVLRPAGERSSTRRRRRSWGKDKDRTGKYGSRRRRASERKSSSDVQDPFSIDATAKLSSMPLLSTPPPMADNSAAGLPTSSSSSAVPASSEWLLHEARLRISRLEAELRRTANDTLFVEPNHPETCPGKTRANEETRELLERVGMLERALEAQGRTGKTMGGGGGGGGEGECGSCLDREREREQEKTRRLVREMRALLEIVEACMASTAFVNF